MRARPSLLCILGYIIGLMVCIIGIPDAQAKDSVYAIHKYHGDITIILHTGADDDAIDKTAREWSNTLGIDMDTIPCAHPLGNTYETIHTEYTARTTAAIPNDHDSQLAACKEITEWDNMDQDERYNGKILVSVIMMGIIPMLFFLIYLFYKGWRDDIKRRKTIP